MKEESIKTINIEKEELENKILELKEEKAEVVSTKVQTMLYFLQNVNDIRFITCDICNETFPNVDDLQSHKNSKHLKSLLESKLQEMQSQINSENVHISLKLVLLKEKENKEVGLS